MKEILTNVLTGMACVLLASLFVYGARLFHIWCEKLKKSTESESLKKLIEKIDYIVQICVEATNQTFVNDKKEEGTFGEDDKKKAYELTAEAITKMLTEIDEEQIIKEFGDVGTFIKTSIENYIKNSKIVQ